jgi:hypothetical protein
MSAGWRLIGQTQPTKEEGGLQNDFYANVRRTASFGKTNDPRGTGSLNPVASVNGLVSAIGHPASSRKTPAKWLCFVKLPEANLRLCSAIRV